jgi:hypothetical protein
MTVQSTTSSCKLFDVPALHAQSLLLTTVNNNSSESLITPASLDDSAICTGCDVYPGYTDVYLYLLTLHPPLCPTRSSTPLHHPSPSSFLMYSLLPAACSVYHTTSLAVHKGVPLAVHKGVANQLVLGTHTFCCLVLLSVMLHLLLLLLHALPPLVVVPHQCDLSRI